MGLFSKLFGKKAAPAPEYVEPGQVYKFVVTTPTQVLEIEAEGFYSCGDSTQVWGGGNSLSYSGSASFTKTRPKTRKGTWAAAETVAFIPGPFVSIIRAGEVK